MACRSSEIHCSDRLSFVFAEFFRSTHMFDSFLLDYLEWSNLFAVQLLQIPVFLINFIFIVSHFVMLCALSCFLCHCMWVKKQKNRIETRLVFAYSFKIKMQNAKKQLKSLKFDILFQVMNQNVFTSTNLFRVAHLLKYFFPTYIIYFLII
jgi:hypothetical protein